MTSSLTFALRRFSLLDVIDLYVARLSINVIISIGFLHMNPHFEPDGIIWSPHQGLHGAFHKHFKMNLFVPFNVSFGHGSF